MKSCKRWSESEISYLTSSWGVNTVAKIASKLQRSQSAIKSEACRLNLGGMLENRSYLTMQDVVEILGSDRKTVKRHMTERGLKYKIKKFNNKQYFSIEYRYFREWIEDNTSLWDATKSDIYSLKALGVNAKLLDIKLLEDTARYNRYNFTDIDSVRLKRMYLAGHTYDEMCNMLNKELSAIRKELSKLRDKNEIILNKNNKDTLIRKTKRDNYGWTKEQDETLIQMFLEGHMLKDIAKVVGKSLSATKTRNRVLSKRVIHNLAI